LMAMGCSMLPSHMFVYYFAILAGVTPPVCIAAYCGAAIAGSKPLQTGFESLKLALVGFIVPYIFVYNNALLMQGSVVSILTVTTLLTLCVILSAGGLSGYLFRRMNFIGQGATLAFAVGTAFLCTKPDLTNQPLMLLVSVAMLSVFSFLVFRKKNQYEPVAVGKASVSN
ncbi:MAG: TRAP transporter large permease subunit, partial [Oceanicoccus sp.]|uniref:TRAP transporter large permease subunit n=1 Tax=Oceanicoccus sp. TaxID=2691044 RepID=UPI0026041914